MAAVSGEEKLFETQDRTRFTLEYGKLIYPRDDLLIESGLIFRRISKKRERLSEIVSFCQKLPRPTHFHSLSSF
jgi:hypothetical protein